MDVQVGCDLAGLLAMTKLTHDRMAINLVLGKHRPTCHGEHRHGEGHRDNKFAHRLVGLYFTGSSAADCSGYGSRRD